MDFISTDKFDQPDSQGNTFEYFTARNAKGQIIAQIVRSSAPNVASAFRGYRMTRPGAGGKAQSGTLRRFGPFGSYEEAKRAIEEDFAANP